MVCRDLRAEGELSPIEVDPDQEIGAIRRKVRVDGGPALLLDRVRGVHAFDVWNLEKHVVEPFPSLKTRLEEDARCFIT